MDKQMVIPGLEGLEKAATNLAHKHRTCEQRIKTLEQRALDLELEVTLLRIQLEGDKHHEQSL